jgi:hypothetical protein
MRIPALRRASVPVASAVVAWVLGLSPGFAHEPVQEATATEAGQSAVWTPKEVRFEYVGFTTYYSCDGLRDRVRGILLQLGARKEDLKVTQTPCISGLGRPDPFPGVLIRMNVLATSSAQNNGAAPGDAVAAHWKTVELKPQGPGLDTGGECELIDQVKRRILPLFATRNVDYSSTCVPHQVNIGGTHLRAEVLVADPKDREKPDAQ